jgi:hypothetical protein
MLPSDHNPTQPTATCSRTGIQTLTVSATGTNLTYSWRRGGTVLINAGYSGQGLDTTLTNSVVADAGSYDVVAVICTRGSDIKSGDGDGKCCSSDHNPTNSSNSDLCQEQEYKH